MAKSWIELMAQMTPEMRHRVDARYKELLSAELATLRAENERLREALAHVAYGGNFTCFVDGSWEIVNEALK